MDAGTAHHKCSPNHTLLEHHGGRWDNLPEDEETASSNVGSVSERGRGFRDRGGIIFARLQAG